MSDWFTIDHVDNDTYIISEYKHWEETHAYLLNGTTNSLLIDTGLGIMNIRDEVMRLTDKPVIAVPTHVHWDHIGGLRYFPEFYIHEEEVNWINGEFPLSLEQVKASVVERCEIPDGFDINEYEIFQGNATRILKDNDYINIGGRMIQVLHTPGHSPGHMCFYEKDKGYLFTGDLVYKDTLYAYYPSTDPQAYLHSIERISTLEVNRVFPAHHDLNIKPSIIEDMRQAFHQLNVEGKLHHGSGVFDYDDFSIWI